MRNNIIWGARACRDFLFDRSNDTAMRHFEVRPRHIEGSNIPECRGLIHTSGVIVVALESHDDDSSQRRRVIGGARETMPDAFVGHAV